MSKEETVEEEEREVIKDEEDYIPIDLELYAFISEGIPEIPNDADIIVAQLLAEITDLVGQIQRREDDIKTVVTGDLSRNGFLDAAAHVRRLLGKDATSVEVSN